ncbi:MAG: peptidylprolyl isomerase [Proteobacteria bacterium]|nr:peptidylprolyl isomerase [Pseudomonadota bacterium]MBU1639228.1 peptidylprolyl isomerase [Pseudomonadota bacterium]
MIIEAGNLVSVHYTGTFEDGEVFDSSQGRDPLSFQVGAGQMIQGFDQAVLGMKQGENKKITLAPEEAYGPRDEELLIDIPAEQFPEEMKLEKGMMLQLTNQAGQPVPATVAEISEESVKMDVNHPMAGKTLVFDIEIVEVK